MSHPVTVGLYSLGCSKNLVDSEVLLGDLLQTGSFALSPPEEAEVLLINTCGFLESAKEESLETIRQAVEWKKQGQCRLVIVIGCLAKRYGEKIHQWVRGVDYVVPLQRYQDLPAILSQEVKRWKRPLAPFAVRHKQNVFAEVARFRLTPRHYAYLRLSEGCNHKCTFCVIPKIRGPHRSKPMEHLIEEAHELASDGVKELNLIADDTCFYGIDLYGRPRLAELLEHLNEVEGIEWIRLFYAYPTTVSEELLQTMAALEKVVPYLDMPIQHIHDSILSAMGRGGSGAVKRALERFRKYLPHGIRRTTVIVGFPGEGEEEFQTLYNFLAEEEFDHLGVFLYSPERGAPSAEYDGQVPLEVKQERYDRLFELQQEIVARKNRARQGSCEVLLVDEDRGEWLAARSWRDGPEVDQLVWLPRGELDVQPGDWVLAEITHPKPFDLEGVALEVLENPQGERVRPWTGSPSRSL